MPRRTIRHRTRSQPKLSRTISIYGDSDRGNGEDSGVWYECWNCGQKNNVNKSKLGGSESPDGVVYVDYAANPDYGSSYGIAVFGGMSNSFTAQLNGSDGIPMPVMNSIMPSDGGTGCSFCGSLNWRGDY